MGSLVLPRKEKDLRVYSVISRSWQKRTKVRTSLLRIQKRLVRMATHAWVSRDPQLETALVQLHKEIGVELYVRAPGTVEKGASQVSSIPTELDKAMAAL